jgi:hypothetical protein
MLGSDEESDDDSHSAVDSERHDSDEDELSVAFDDRAMNKSMPPKYAGYSNGGSAAKDREVAAKSRMSRPDSDDEDDFLDEEGDDDLPLSEGSDDDF